MSIIINPLHVIRLSESCTRLLDYCKSTPVPKNCPTTILVMCIMLFNTSIILLQWYTQHANSKLIKVICNLLVYQEEDWNVKTLKLNTQISQEKERQLDFCVQTASNWTAVFPSLLEMGTAFFPIFSGGIAASVASHLSLNQDCRKSD